MAVYDSKERADEMFMELNSLFEIGGNRSVHSGIIRIDGQAIAQCNLQKDVGILNYWQFPKE